MDRMTWKQKLSYWANMAPVRVVFNSPEIEYRAMLAKRKIKAEIYSINNGFAGTRAVFAVN